MLASNSEVREGRQQSKAATPMTPGHREGKRRRHCAAQVQRMALRTCMHEAGARHMNLAWLAIERDWSGRREIPLHVEQVHQVPEKQMTIFKSLFFFLFFFFSFSENQFYSS